MPTFIIGFERLVLAGLLCVVASYAHGEAATHFDLVCRGSGRNGLQEKPQISTLRLSLDLQQKRFCIDEFCDQLTTVTKDKLSYLCEAEASGRFCEGSLIRSSGGPFISHEDFVFDRASRHFSRSSLGSMGDIIRKPFNASFSGTCTRAPFTGLRSVRP